MSKLNKVESIQQCCLKITESDLVRYYRYNVLYNNNYYKNIYYKYNKTIVCITNIIKYINKSKNYKIIQVLKDIHFKIE